MNLIFHLSLQDGPYFREVLEQDLVLICGLDLFSITVQKISRLTKLWSFFRYCLENFLLA